tara:strand:+ start:216 stop:419 length:204 start_codon:yes stop_codon:yes gene_type:complete
MDYRLQKVIDFFKEEGGPTMSAGTGGFSGSANPAGPVAGFDPLLAKKKFRRKTLGKWAQSLQKKNLA